MIMRYLIFSLVFSIKIQITNAQQVTAKPIVLKNLKNLYRLNHSIYRSEQPTKKEFVALENLGVKTVLNLRRLKEDNKKARGTDLALEHLRLKSKEITEADLLDALRIIKHAKKPILVHCWHGSDRTGVVMASYRIVFENWTKADAIAEFRKPEFGYHENWYPNLLDILKNLNVEEIRSTLGL